jgi:asparagine synthase (glutamine-hydrolysing)
MCGIAGYFSKNNFFSRNDLENMTGILAHRGPDADGFFYDNVVGLGHRRLSILDLSSNGNQPMYSQNKRYLMVYNGEVYNYKEIANEIRYKRKTNDLNFHSSSDTEIILEAFVEWGTDFVHKLNGMFSIAIYDTLNQELFLFRDRIGIKPLFYFWNGSDFAFASELKALKQVKNIPRDIDEEAIYYYLNSGFIPAPFSIYKNIRKLKPGMALKISSEGMDSDIYWSIKSSVKKEIIKDEKKALIKLSDLLMSSVLYQMKSDVPFGVFLSGGIDSSLLTAQAVNLSSVKVNTFSIGFEESKYNEATYAKGIAGYLRTNHHEFILSYKDAIELIDKNIAINDEPYADSSSIPTMLVSRLARKYVTVVLSGDGGDELFFGYGAYQWAKRLHNPLIKFFRHPLSSAFSTLSNKYQRGAKLFEYYRESDIESHILSQEQYFFSRQELMEMLCKKPENFLNSTLDISHYSFPRKISAMEKQAIFDLYYYLPDDLLTKVDRSSMKYSLEARVPYLDHRIIEFALNISPHLKYKNGITKYLLKEILYQYIPQKFFQRPKQGFAIPLEQWLKNELRYLIEDNLSKSVVENFNFVKYSYVKQLKESFFSGKNYLYNRLWALSILHMWAKNEK